MSHPEFSNLDPSCLPLSQLQEGVFGNGWEHQVDGAGFFIREYARVNDLLAGNEWREAVRSFPAYLDKRTLNVSRGLGVLAENTDTEVTIIMVGKKDSFDSLTKAYILNEHLRLSGFEDIEEGPLADWMELKEIDSTFPLGSKSFYEQDPRAAEIRAVTLAAADAYRRAVLGGGVESSAMAEVLDLNRRLAELAIEPDMKSHAGRLAYGDPVTRAEYFAGYLRAGLFLGTGLVSGARSLLEEHDRLAGEGPGGIGMIGPEAPRSARETAFALNALAFVAKGLDAKADEPKE